jgi:tetratricopeptide (TPR) repeat protein
VLAACSAATGERARPPAEAPLDLADPVARGDVAAREGRTDDAVAAYEEAVARDRSAVRPHLRLVAAWSAAGRRSLARDRYARVVASPGATEAERVMAARLATDGSPPAVRAVYVAAAKAAPDNPWWRLALAEIDLASADGWIRKQARARSDGDRPGATEAEATAVRALARAQSAVENAAARAPDLPEVALYRGLLRSLESEMLTTASARAAAQRAAADAFARAVTIDPWSVDGWANLADARRRVGEPAEALAAYLAALRLAPSDPELRLGAGAVLHELERDGDAAAQFLEAARLAPTEAAPLVAAGDAFAAAGEHEDALAAWGRALDRDAKVLEVHVRRGTVLETLGRTAEAREEYATYLERGGPDAALVRRRIERLTSPEAAK